MNNIDKIEIKAETNISIWDIFRMFLKNWLLMSIIIVVLVSAGLIYSFVVQDQNEVSYSSNDIVIFNSWKYYPVGIIYSYQDDVKMYIKEEMGKSYVSQVTLKVTSATSNLVNSNDKEYGMNVIYLSSASLDEVKLAAQKIAKWHNNMLDAEVQRISEDKEQNISELYEEYENVEREYLTFLVNADMSDIDNILEANILESEKNALYEMWKNEKIEIRAINEDLNKISDYYIDVPEITVVQKITWKMNMIIAVFLGLFLSVSVVLGKESYKEYKSNKTYSR